MREALKDQEMDAARAGLLAAYTEGAVKKIPGALVQAYCIVVTVSEANEVQAFKIQVGDAPRCSRRSRPISAAGSPMRPSPPTRSCPAAPTTCGGRVKMRGA